MAAESASLTLRAVGGLNGVAPSEPETLACHDAQAAYYGDRSTILNSGFHASALATGLHRGVHYLLSTQRSGAGRDPDWEDTQLLLPNNRPSQHCDRALANGDPKLLIPAWELLDDSLNVEHRSRDFRQVLESLLQEPSAHFSAMRGSGL